MSQTNTATAEYLASVIHDDFNAYVDISRQLQWQGILTPIGDYVVISSIVDGRLPLRQAPQYIKRLYEPILNRKHARDDLQLSREVVKTDREDILKAQDNVLADDITMAMPKLAESSEEFKSFRFEFLRN